MAFDESSAGPDVPLSYDQFGQPGDPRWGAGSWTVVWDAGGEAELVSRLGEHELLAPTGLPELFDLDSERDLDDELDALAWVIAGSRGFGLFEPNGYATGLSALLRALSGDGATACGCAWLDDREDATFTFADNGEVEIVEVFDADLTGTSQFSQHDAIAAVIAERPDAHPTAWCLRAVERISGLALVGSVLSQRWPVVRFASEPHPTSPAGRTDSRAGVLYRDGVLRAFDPELADLLGTADPDLRAQLRDLVLAEALTTTRLSNEPALRSTADALARGKTPGLSDELLAAGTRLNTAIPTLINAMPDTQHPAWRGYQAAAAVNAFASGRPERGARAGEGWFHAASAMGDRWPTVRAMLISRLRNGQ